MNLEADVDGPFGGYNAVARTPVNIVEIIAALLDHAPLLAVVSNRRDTIII